MFRKLSDEEIAWHCALSEEDADYYTRHAFIRDEDHIHARAICRFTKRMEQITSALRAEDV